MKLLKRLCTFLVAMGIALAPVTPVAAVDSVVDAETAKQGVVQVNTVIVDENSEKRLVIGGAGFIIGDAEGTEYVITSKHIVSPDQETLGAACQYYGLVSGNDTSINLRIATEVVIEGDVVLNASVLTSSNELDMVVLQLPQPIYTRTPLKLLTNKKYDVNNLPYGEEDAVYALGLPEMVSYESETQYYSDQQVQMSYGEIKSLGMFEGVQVVESDAATDLNNYGGPLVDQNGYVIGMNLPMHDGENSCALDSTKIAKILDGLGVSYSQVNSVPKDEVEDEETVEAKAKFKQPVATPAAKSNKGISETMIVVISLVAVFVVVCGVAGLILFFVNRDKSDSAKPKKEKKVYNGPVFDMDTTPKSSVKMTASKTPQRNMLNMAQPKTAASDETTILSAVPSNDGETSLLSEELNVPQNLGTLVRKRTSEKISLSKSDFVIGKDALHADYCIEKNSSISRKHAMITSGRNGAYIQDCNSTNGTFINGTKLESERAVLLNNGDIIKLSNEEFEYLA
ncbi:Trypsin-like peptidase domain-containing protein [Pseudobutyrivibrio sp. 49]|uniref:FHA domain-containing protein n=1 Tax=unclassified Pseudobutyrivibrio TaxID=2638619 RepID=UPI0008884E4E|nr:MULTISPECIES: FHA domain-containing protein [unclassified Pseudobutyrivibrio]SDI35631.1 Trypsin-like peptidase domain-containing protein [Pseudobutyrivibrio sp. 49]SFN94373.1 Trypsin-like peptidase domain-containing protein [Pseudobutyrivibrio sp. UC1225]